MLKILKVLTVIFLTSIPSFRVPLNVYAQIIVPTFTIKDFQSHIDLNHDGTFVVTEQIKVNFETSSSNFIRNIPLTTEEKSTNNKYIDRILDFQLVSITKDGIPVNYSKKHIEQTNSQLNTLYFANNYNVENINIGDKDSNFLGSTSFVIKYIIGNGIRGNDKRATVNWHVLDDTWNANVEKASFSMSLFDDTDTSKIIQGECFVGPQNISISNDCTSNSINDKTFKAEVNKAISPNEDFKVNVTFSSGYLGIDTFSLGNSTTPIQSGISKTKLLVNIALLILPIIFLLSFFYFLRRSTKKKFKKASPFFNIPDDLKPAQAGLVYENHFENVDLSITIIDLAIRGYLIIKKVPIVDIHRTVGDYIFIKTNKELISLENFEIELINGIFESRLQTQLIDLEYKFYGTLHNINMSLKDWSYQSQYFESKSWTQGKKIFGLLAIIFFFAIFTSLQGMFYANKYFTFMQCSLEMLAIFGTTIMFVVINAKSSKGKAIQEKIHGLKRFLLADGIKKNKINMNVEVFEKFLPFALLFNFEESWAEQFGDIYDKPPIWYQEEFNIFNLMSLVTSLASASKEITAVLTSKEIVDDSKDSWS